MGASIFSFRSTISTQIAVTGANATTAQTAAVKSVGSGTAGAVTTDFTGKGYEVTVTKADGSTTEGMVHSRIGRCEGRPYLASS